MSTSFQVAADKGIQNMNIGKCCINIKLLLYCQTGLIFTWIYFLDGFDWRKILLVPSHQTLLLFLSEDGW